MSDESDLHSIPPSALEDVSGGTGSTSSCDDQISAALQGIQDSLKDLKSNNGNNANWFAQMLPFFLLLRGGSFTFRSGGGGCPICGMSPCSHHH